MRDQIDFGQPVANNVRDPGRAYTNVLLAAWHLGFSQADAREYALAERERLEKETTR